jgi:hypothetical protein
MIDWEYLAQRQIAETQRALPITGPASSILIRTRSPAARGDVNITNSDMLRGSKADCVRQNSFGLTQGRLRLFHFTQSAATYASTSNSYP